MLLQPPASLSTSTNGKLSKPCNVAPRRDRIEATIPAITKDNIPDLTHTNSTITAAAPLPTEEKLVQAAMDFITWKLGKPVPIVLATSFHLNETGPKIVQAWAELSVPPESKFFITGLATSECPGLQVCPSFVKQEGGRLEVLVICNRAPFLFSEGAKLAQRFAIPIDCLTSSKEPQVLWAEVLGSNRPTLDCELSQGDQLVPMSGMVDTGADVTVISCREWPQTWRLEPVAGNIVGVGGNITALKSAQKRDHQRSGRTIS